MAVARKVWTYEDLLDIPEDISNRHEIIDGELYVSPSPRVPHQRVSLNLTKFALPADEADLGRLYYAPVDVVLDEHNVFVPDLIFVAKDRLSIVQETHVHGAPDLVVEILSPGTQHRDLGIKLQAYARFGVKYYWVVDLYSQSVQVFVLQDDHTFAEPRLLEGDDQLTCPLFAELGMPVSQLFA
ncbi:MAG TPA: Uma2 family endonuclease [Chloroflexota bacterium]|jgi:Uma2 family endonuclease